MNNQFAYIPASYIKNFNSLRAVCFYAGGFGLIQALIWTALTIFGILLYSCIVSVEDTHNYGSLFGTVFLQLYFMGSCDNSTTADNNSILRQVETVLKSQDIFIMDCVYLALAVCWFSVSILIMTYIEPERLGKTIGILWTWITVTFCICAIDLTLGIIFSVDYTRFNSEAYKYNLSGIYAGTIDADAIQLLAGMVVSMSMLIISLKGFVLWLINFSFLIYLAARAISIRRDSMKISNLTMSGKEPDDTLAARPPINAYLEEHKPLPTVFSNGGFVLDDEVQKNTAVINREIIARAARLSADVSLHEGRFRNLNNFRQYPPNSSPDSITTEQSQQQTSPIVVSAFPAPDYTPPMQRAAQNPNRNLRFQ